MKNKHNPVISAIIILSSVILLSTCGKPSPSLPKSVSPAPSPGFAQPSSELSSEDRAITDMVGRKVSLPKTVNKVYCASPVSTVMLYTVNPEKLLGWNYALNDLEKSYIPQRYQDLPVFGMEQSVNLEAIISHAPGLCIMDGIPGKKAVSDADKLQLQTGIPVVVVDSSLENSAAAYRFLGEVLNEEDKADQLAVYAEETIEAIREAKIPENEKIRVYYGNGAASLETAPKGSASSEVIDMVGADNVAGLELGEGNRMKVSLEQVLYWDPEIIVVNGEPTMNLTGKAESTRLLGDPGLSNITAVKNRKVFGIPKAPFSWIDRPPGPNRLIGLKWLAHLVYPEYFQYDMAYEVIGFYKLFYGVSLTDSQLSELLPDRGGI